MKEWRKQHWAEGEAGLRCPSSHNKGCSGSPGCSYEKAISQSLLGGPKPEITCALLIGTNETTRYTTLGSLRVPGTLLGHVSCCTFVILPKSYIYFHSTQQTIKNMRNKFRQNQQISKNLAVTTWQKDETRERIQHKYFLWDNFLKTYLEPWVEAKGWEVWSFLFEIFFVLLFVRVRCRKQRKRLCKQTVANCQLAFLWNKAEPPEKKRRKRKKAKSVF